MAKTKPQDQQDQAAAATQSQAEPSVTTSQQLINDMPDIFTTEGGHDDAGQQKAAGEQQTAQQTAAGEQTQQTQATTEQISPVIQRLRDLGFQDIADEAQGTERLISAFEQEQQRRQEIEERVNELRTQNLLMQSQLATATGTSGQPGQQAPASVSTLGQESDDPWPRIPVLNASDHQLFMKHRDEEGNWKPGTPPPIIQKATEFEAACTEWSNRIIMDPKGALQPIIDHEVKKALQEALGGQPQEFFEKQYETRTQQETRQTEAANAWERIYPWMWQADPITMQPSKIPTEFGRRFQSSFAEAQQELKQLNPNLDDDSLFFHAMQSAYRRHEYELASLERQWQEYQAQQQAGGNGAGQAQAQGDQQAAQARQAVDPRQQAQQEFLARNRRSNATGGERTGSMQDNGQGRKKGPATMGANAVGIDFVKGLAADGFFQGVA